MTTDEGLNSTDNEDDVIISKPTFQSADYAVFAAFIFISLGIGVFHAVRMRKKQTTKEYHVASRQMHVIPVALSMVVTYESSSFMMGSPAEMYYFGINYIFVSIGWFLAVFGGTFAYVSLIHSLNITSISEYLELRFRRVYVRKIISILQVIGNLLYMGIVLYGPALALQGVTGYNVYLSIVIIAAVAGFYTTVGGLRAVIWTDLLQSLIMVAGMIAVIVKGSAEVGGFTKVWNIGKDNGRLNPDFRADPTLRLTFWIAVFGTYIRLCTIVLSQASCQRITSLPTVRHAKMSFMIAAPWFVMFSMLANLEGLVAFAYYHQQGCDLLESKQIKNKNQMIILFVLELFKDTPGLAGFFVAALFSAALSTMSTGLGSISANFWEDILKPVIGRASETKATAIAKGLVIIATIVSIGISVVISHLGGTLVMITSTVLGLTGAPITSYYLLAAIFPFANAEGATIGAVAGALTSGWLLIGSRLSTKLPGYDMLPLPSSDKCLAGIIQNTTSLLPSINESDNLGVDVLYTLSPYLYTPVAVTINVIVGLVASIIIEKFVQADAPVDSKYLPSFIATLWKKTRYVHHYTSVDTPMKELVGHSG